VPRVKRGVTTHQKHKSLLALTKGHRATRHALVKRAKESMIKALSYSYAHTRVNAASRLQGITYGELIDGLKRSGVEINRKLLADMAVREPEAFAELVTIAKKKS
jgi:large subunit ribosomal protein L20